MSNGRRPAHLRDVLRSPLAGLFLLGLAVRLAGTLFNGITDLYQILLDWGFSVHRDGLVSAFRINYGILSYAMFGLAAAGAESIPRFWWAPYKLIILAFDIALLLVLLRIVPPERRKLALALYWLNPWFVLHEAYYGFWEAPHILFGLLAVLVVRRTNRVGAWALAGALLMGSAMFKPQGLVHFIGPVGVYLAVQALRGTTAPLGWYLVGISTTVAGTSALIRATGGSALALFNNYRSAFTLQSGISNGGPGIWRFIAFVYMRMTGQTGHVSFSRMPRPAIGALSAVAAIASLTILVAFAWQGRFKHDRKSSDEEDRGRAQVFLLVLALGSFVLSQFGARAHINHTYTAMVLLVPLAVASREMRQLWVAMNVLLGLSHLLIFGLGNAFLLPPADILHRYTAAQGLIAQVTSLPAYRTPDWLMLIQQWVGDGVQRLPGETIVSLLSVVVFVMACLTVRTIFKFDRTQDLI